MRYVLVFFCLIFCFWFSLAWYPLPHPLANRPYSTLFLDRDGRFLKLTLASDESYRLPTKLDDIPPWALDAVLACEDRWFWYHPGVNPCSLVRSLVTMLFGGRRMGGSTLTMQTVRLAYRVQTRTIPGKIRQIFLALVLERKLSKAEILEAYFTLAPYGGNVEGLSAAARLYFHKGPASLSRSEAEALMLVPQNPVARRPTMENAALEKARARAAGVREFAPLRIFRPRDLPSVAPHLVSELARSTKGYVRTTLVSEKQALLETCIARSLSRLSPYGIDNAAALLVHWPTRNVEALVGSADFTNERIHGQIDGTAIRRSPGSTLKPFIYALALEQGLIHPMSLLIDTPRSFRGYTPENFDHRYQGPLDATRALRLSRNVPAIALAERLKNPDLYDFLVQANVAFAKSRDHYGLALVLGGAEVTMRELAALYCMLANRGVWKPLRFVHASDEAIGKRLLHPETAYCTVTMLSPLDMGGSETLARFKTGTSNGFRDAWTVGYVGPYVLVVWIGNFNARSNPLFVGAEVALPLFASIARSLAATSSMRDMFAKPWPDTNVTIVPVCRATGDVDTRLCQDTVDCPFIPGVSPIKNSGIFRTITIDTATGLRACRPEAGRTEDRVWEFWPGELASLFRLAGIPKAPPPPYEPSCRHRDPGEAPQILSPKRGLIYHARLSEGGQTSIALRAYAEAGVTQLDWFVNGQFVGRTLPGESLSHAFSPGKYHILVADPLGRSQARTVRVEAEP
ncbi:MAG: penicillin-binding protein 1C [Desulfovibrionaceae bacterium]|nr:penicillin-binding protein 1C [Desulfovibrionaceae bacterium]